MFEGAISTLTPLGAAFTLVLGILMYVLPRRHAPIPMLIAGCYITLGQMWYVAGLHFSVMRIIILVGWLRVISRGEYKQLRFNQVDKALLAWAFANVIIYNIQWQTYEAFINRLGFFYNAAGIYFLFRFLIRDMEEATLVIKITAYIVLPFAVLMLYENTTGHNLFSVFGGVPEYTVIRDGRLRCQGPFRHPILAGTLGATLMPCFAGLWFVKGAKMHAIVGLVSATVITIFSASSGPLMAYVAGVIALILWKAKNYMRIIRWCLLFVIISLHVTMKAPIWYLMARLSEIVGGTGWHRAELINQAVKNIDEWWLVGTHHTAHWMPYVLPDDPDMVDITNQYLWEGLVGGLLTMFLFIALIARGFQCVGTTVHSDSQSTEFTFVAWALGTSLFTHVMSFTSVIYFDQMVVFWYLLLSMIAAICRTEMKRQELTVSTI